MTARPLSPAVLLEVRRYVAELFVTAQALVRAGDLEGARFYIELASELLGAVGAKGEPS